MASFKDQFTRELHNEGVRLPLYDPEWKESGEWLQVLGVDSDAFEAAKAKINAQRLAESDDKAKTEKASEAQRTRRLLSVLVCGWSFDEPCTRENVIELFQQAPHIADQVNQAASRVAYWIRKKKENSSKPQESDSASTG